MKQIHKNAFLLVFCLILKISLCYGQDIQFNRVIPKDGTNFGDVNDITQDKDGFMWFATIKGLYKYDGNKLTRFKNDPENINSISSIKIKALHADSNGILWIGNMGQGLDRYDPETGIFTHFKHDPNDATSIAANSITEILRDHRGILWIGTNEGLDQYDPKTNGFIHFKSEKDDASTLSDNQVRCLYEDQQGTLWIGTGNPWKSQPRFEPEYGGLNKYNRETGTFTQYLSKVDDAHSLVSNKVFSIFEDNKGVFWIGTYDNGLHQMDRKKGTFKQMFYDPTDPETFGNLKFENKQYKELVYFITQDTTGGYWLGKFRSGLYYFNPAMGEMHKFQGTRTEINGFIERSVYVAYTSRDGVLWLGGTEGNIYKVNLLNKKIPKPFVTTDPVNTLFEEQDGTFWIGKRNDLIRVDKKNGDTLKFNNELNLIHDSNNNIKDIQKDLQGNLWVSAQSGLFKWDSVNHKFKGYHHDSKNENSLSHNEVQVSFEDSRNNFWVGTSFGLNLLDRQTGKFSSADGPPMIFNSAIIEDKSSNVWVGSWFRDGLRRYNLDTKLINTYLKNINIAFVFEDSDGVLWAGGENGLYTFDPEEDSFVRFGNSYALAGLSDAFGMAEDNLKKLWITTSESIVRLNQQRNETSIFGENYGIEKKSLKFGVVHKGKNGDLYFPHKTGFYQIDPSVFPQTAESGEINFTRFSLFDQEIKLSKNGSLKEPLQEATTIKLRYNQNVFSFDFTLIDFTNPEETRLLYYLEDYDNDWMPSYSERKASYFNIPPGSYVFHVKGTNSSGVWVEKEIEVIILPPWYLTWYAFVTYALVFIAGLFAFDRMQRKRIIRKEQMKNQERELAQAKEIEKAYAELKSTQSQLIQSEKMASLGELTAGIAHEIQNPLNFVNNFSEVSEELLTELKEELEKGDVAEANEISNDVIENLKKINHHGQRASGIVKGMLEHSRTGDGVKEPTDINELADEFLRLAYHGLRAKDNSFNADFKTEFDKALPKLNVVPQDIGRVLLNLINNAFYAVNQKAVRHSDPEHSEGEESGVAASHDGYQPEVIVSTKLSPLPTGQAGSGGGQGEVIVQISVKDNGEGIPEQVLDKIFQPFFTTKPTGSGTGLGLSLSYDIVKAHGGELKVESPPAGEAGEVGEVGEGSEFIIIIPVQV